MKRRSFLGATAGAGALAAISGCDRDGVDAEAPGGIGDIGGRSLDDLRAQFHAELYDIHLPLMDEVVIDREHGGFMCNARCDGVHVNTNKRTWYEGRGIWVYSYLHNTLDKDTKYMEIARKSMEFILKNEPSGNTLWHAWFTREGNPIGEPDPVIYSDLFVAEGLQEYAKATGEERWFDKARTILMKMMRVYDIRPGFGAMPAIEGAEAVPSTRILGHWMLPLHLLNQMIEKKSDPELEAMADRCTDMIMNYHYNPEYNLFNEYLNHDLTRIDGGYGNMAFGHGQEAMWMVMERALAKKDAALFSTCAERLKRQIEVFWDDVYGGEMLELLDVNANRWNTQKSMWLHDEILIGTMMVIEHTGAEWAKHWFTENLNYIRNKLDLRNHGYRGWVLFADRKATFNPAYDRTGNFHHPRHLIMNMLAIDRIKQRGGKTSGLMGG